MPFYYTPYILLPLLPAFVNAGVATYALRRRSLTVMAKYKPVPTHCPFTKQPFAECDVRTITGATIPGIIRYCMTDYTLCPVYTGPGTKGMSLYVL